MRNDNEKSNENCCWIFLLRNKAVLTQNSGNDTLSKKLLPKIKVGKKEASLIFFFLLNQNHFRDKRKQKKDTKEKKRRDKAGVI